VSPLFVARAVSAGRLLIGAAMMVKPPLAMNAWIGEDEAQRPVMQMVVRSFGFREVFLGGLGLHVAHREGVGPRTLQTLAACDAVDLSVTILHRDALPKVAVPMMAAVAGGAAISQLWASRALS
jgi:hypothetical protein